MAQRRLAPLSTVPAALATLALASSSAAPSPARSPERPTAQDTGATLRAAGPDREARDGDVRRSVERARGWLLRQQGEDGGFHASAPSGAPSVSLTAMALWALSVDGALPEAGPLAPARAKAARFLLAHQQADGGVYRPDQGVAHLTSAVVRQALRAWSAARGEPASDVAAALARLDAYLAQDRAMESWTPGASSAEDLQGALAGLGEDGDLTPGARRALEFLRRVEEGRDATGGATGGAPDAGFTYEQLLGQLAAELRPGDASVVQAYDRLQERYTLEENPDLTRRYGPAGFVREDSGLYYYFLTVARVLGTVGDPVLVTADGTPHSWALELEGRLLRLQRPDGPWVNANARWCEDEPILVTSYALIALDLCRRVRREKR